MSTNIVQSVHQKCLELHNLVSIFLILFLREDPQHPHSPVLSKDVFKEIIIFYTVKMSPTSVLVPSFLVKKQKQNLRPAPFLKSWIRHCMIHMHENVCVQLGLGGLGPDICATNRKVV